MTNPKRPASVTFTPSESYRGERVEMRVEVKRAESLDEAIEAVENRIGQIQDVHQTRRRLDLCDALDVLRAERERRRGCGS